MSSNAERLGHWVKARRDELGLSQITVWQAGGPSNTKLTEIENGRLEQLTPSTARKLDSALSWEPGSARRVWEGGEPVAEGESERRDAAWLRRMIDEAEIPAAMRLRLLAALDHREGVRGA